MGHLKIIIAILIWSSLGIFVRKVGLPNEVIVFYSTSIGALLQCILLLSMGQFREVFRPAAGIVRLSLFVLLPLFSLANVLLFYYAFTATSIANAVLTHYTAPVFVALTAPFVLKERIKRVTWMAIMVSTLGMWLILGAPSVHEWLSLKGTEQNGILAGALSGLAYALIILVVRRIAGEYPSLAVIFVQNSMMALLLLPFVLRMGAVPPQALWYLVLMGAVHSCIAPVLYVQGFRSVRANEAAILGYFEPVGAILLAFIFFHEVPTATAFAGGAMILFSGYLILRSNGKHTG